MKTISSVSYYEPGTDALGLAGDHLGQRQVWGVRDILLHAENAFLDGLNDNHKLSKNSDPLSHTLLSYLAPSRRAL